MANGEGLKKWAAKVESVSLPKLKQRQPAGLPAAWGVLYAHPNPDGNRKRCDNCFMWARSEQCWIHSPAVKVPASAVCGYHVFGPPSDTRPDIPLLAPVEPGLSGLMDVGGTSCDACRWYESELAASGKCYAVLDDAGKLATVEAMGCCARFEGR
jgi:hypothetical protein